MLDNLVYLDHNSTTTPIDGLVDIIQPLMSAPLNPSSIHKLGRNARKLLQDARTQILESATSSSNAHKAGYRVIFTSGATEANNLIIRNFSEDYILYSPTNHASVIEPARLLKNATMLKVDEMGLVDLDYLESLLQKLKGARVLVSVMAANNETGIIEDISAISSLVHSFGAYIHSDCAQLYGKAPLDLADIGADFVSISSHKIGGLAGSGALIVRGDFEIKAEVSGGGQEKGERSGTEGLIPAVSFGYAASFVPERVKFFETKVKKMRDFIEEAISDENKSAMIVGRGASRLPNTTLFITPNLGANLQLMLFDREGICLSNGAACSSGVVKPSHVLMSMGFSEDEARCAIRVSFGVTNTMKDVEKFISVWKKIGNKI
ncbi:MAG: cysteine desulfurase family protein [Rickettsiaceae bacterium]|nr:cysteine desulfurase family protein [Rickettsiaceae bacterium]